MRSATPALGASLLKERQGRRRHRGSTPRRGRSRSPPRGGGRGSSPAQERVTRSPSPEAVDSFDRARLKMHELKPHHTKLYLLRQEQILFCW